jgi:hypothetical protein
MGHQVRAFIGQRSTLESITQRYGVAPVVDLPQRLAILPLLDELYDALEDTAQTGVSADHPFVFLSSKVGNLLVSHADQTGLLYFETDYAGGVGTQGAVVAKSGKVVFGPASGAGTINAALELIGVRKGLSKDAFEALGLGEQRTNEDWTDQGDT